MRAANFIRHEPGALNRSFARELIKGAGSCTRLLRAFSLRLRKAN
jgi:hypothetical protein